MSDYSIELAQTLVSRTVKEERKYGCEIWIGIPEPGKNGGLQFEFINHPQSRDYVEGQGPNNIVPSRSKRFERVKHPQDPTYRYEFEKANIMQYNPDRHGHRKIG